MNPFQVLDLQDTASADEVEQRWRELRKSAHPDHGGDADRFDELLKAYRLAKAEASAPATCPACAGLGTVPHSSGFHVVMITCPTCHGNKVIKRGES